MNTGSIEDATKAACAQVQIEFKRVPIDGRFHATNVINDPKGRNAGRIKIFPDRQGGICWNWKGEKLNFFVNHNNADTSYTENKEQIEKEKQRRNKVLKDRHDKAAKRVKVIWDSAKPANPGHPYLQKKHVASYRLRQASWEKQILGNDGRWKKITIENSLLIPLYNLSGVIRNIQCIFPTTHPELGRGKDFFSGAELSGLFGWLGDKTESICIAEGFATAATIHHETGLRVYIAFTANNLLAVGRIIRKQLPESKIIYCADNDLETKNNPGVTKANEAALAVGGFVTKPPMEGDFNDYSCYLRKENDKEKR